MKFGRTDQVDFGMIMGFDNLEVLKVDEFYTTIERAHDTFISDVWRVKGSNFERTFKIGEGKFKEQNKNINVSDL